MLFWQFLELGVVLVAAVEEVVALLFYCQEFFLFLLLGNGLQQVLFDCVVHEDVQLFLKGLVLELGHIDLHDTFHHFCDDFSGVGHYFGQSPGEDIELHQKFVFLRLLLFELLDLERVVLDIREVILLF